MARRKHGPKTPRAKSANDPGAGRIYGAHAVLAALANPARRIERLQITENALARHREAIDRAPVRPEVLSADKIAAQLPRDAVHQGMLLDAAPLPEPDLDDACHGGLVVVLDQVSDPHNVGAILRSCAAFGASALVMTARHSPPQSATLAKAASGALEHVALVKVPNLARALDTLGQRGFTRVGLDSDADGALAGLDASPPLALVLGAEGKGLRRLTREHVDHLVRIEASGSIASLNVSNAAAIALYALRTTALNGG